MAMSMQLGAILFLGLCLASVTASFRQGILLEVDCASEGEDGCCDGSIVGRWNVRGPAWLGRELHVTIDGKLNESTQSVKASMDLSHLSPGHHTFGVQVGAYTSTVGIQRCDQPKAKAPSEGGVGIRFPVSGVVLPPIPVQVEVGVEGPYAMGEEEHNVFLTVDGQNPIRIIQSLEIIPLPLESGEHELSVMLVDTEGDVVGDEQSIRFTVADPASAFGLGYFNWVPDNIVTSPFPYYPMEPVLDPALYAELKRTWPDEKFFPTETIQLGKRRNMGVGSPGFQEWIKTAPAWKRFVDYMHSSMMVDFVDKLFPDHLKREFGYVADRIETISFDMSIGVADYTTPVHVDTRSRAAVFLLYFGQDEIETGGDICVLEHKKLGSWEDYPQFPKLSDITHKRCWPPRDNVGMIFLNTPNSYHWPKAVQGFRKFLYVGINSNKESAWKCGWTLRHFREGIEEQKGLDNWEPTTGPIVA